MCDTDVCGSVLLWRRVDPTVLPALAGYRYMDFAAAASANLDVVQEAAIAALSGAQGLLVVNDTTALPPVTGDDTVTGKGWSGLGPWGSAL